MYNIINSPKYTDIPMCKYIKCGIIFFYIFLIYFNIATGQLSIIQNIL